MYLSFMLFLFKSMRTMLYSLAHKCTSKDKNNNIKNDRCCFTFMNISNQKQKQLYFFMILQHKNFEQQLLLKRNTCPQ